MGSDTATQDYQGSKTAGGNALSGEVVPVSDTRAAILSAAEEWGLELQQTINAIPEAGAEGEINILRQIFSATDASQLDKAWNSNGLAVFVDKPVTVVSIRRMPSGFSDGLGWYLICDVIDRTTGEKSVVTTGSVAVVGQLIKAFALNAFPLNVIPRQAERPSKNGYFPMHLEIAVIKSA